MKKFLFVPLLFLIVALIIPMTAGAASIGNPDTLGGLGKVAVGLEYDSLSQPLTLKNGSMSDGFYSEDFGANNMKLKTRTGYLIATVGILENLDAFAGVGINKARIGFDMTYAEGGSDAIEVKDNSNVAYKLGVRGKVAEISGVNIGAMAQYSAFSMHGGFTVNGQELVDMFYDQASYNTKTTVHEWQAAVTASKHVGNFNPYVGAVARKTVVRHTTNISVTGEGDYTMVVSAKARQAHTLDAVLGTGIEITKHIGADVEYQPFNKEASAYINYRF